MGTYIRPPELEARNKYLIKEARKGRQLTELAKEYGISRERVRQIVSAAGVIASEISRERTQKRNQELVEDAHKGASLRVLSEKYGLRDDFIRQILRSNGFGRSGFCIDCGKKVGMKRDRCVACARIRHRSLLVNRYHNNSEYRDRYHENQNRYRRKVGLKPINFGVRRNRPKPWVCEECGEELPDDAHPNRKYCDDVCHQKVRNRNAMILYYSRERKIRKCSYCGKKLPENAAKSQKYCRLECRFDAALERARNARDAKEAAREGAGNT